MGTQMASTLDTQLEGQNRRKGTEYHQRSLTLLKTIKRSHPAQQARCSLGHLHLVCLHSSPGSSPESSSLLTRTAQGSSDRLSTHGLLRCTAEAWIGSPASSSDHSPVLVIVGICGSEPVGVNTHIR